MIRDLIGAKLPAVAAAASGASGGAIASGQFLGAHANKTPLDWALLVLTVLIGVALASWGRHEMVQRGDLTPAQRAAALRVTLTTYAMLASVAFGIVLSTGLQIGGAVVTAAAVGVAGPDVVSKWLKRHFEGRD